MAVFCTSDYTLVEQSPSEDLTNSECVAIYRRNLGPVSRPHPTTFTSNHLSLSHFSSLFVALSLAWHSCKLFLSCECLTPRFSIIFCNVWTASQLLSPQATARRRIYFVFGLTGTQNQGLKDGERVIRLN